MFELIELIENQSEMVDFFVTKNCLIRLQKKLINEMTKKLRNSFTKPMNLRFM